MYIYVGWRVFCVSLTKDSDYFAVQQRPCCLCNGQCVYCTVGNEYLAVFYVEEPQAAKR